MADRLKDLGHVTAEAARKYASRQAEAGTRYADVLQQFGAGKTTVGKYTAQLAGLAIKESARSAEAYFSASADWVQDVLKILGDSAKDTSTKAEDAVRTVKRAAASPPAAK
jgi:hypothetical protein